MRVLLIVLLLTGCVYQEGDDSHVLVVGDSLCAYVEDDHALTWPELAGYSTDCIVGRRVADVETIPKGFPIVILELGSNDGFMRGDIDQFRRDYQRLVDQVDGHLICVLPLARVEGNHAYRQVVQSICSTTIDMWACGFKSRASDGVHGNWKDHWEFFDSGCLP